MNSFLPELLLIAILALQFLALIPNRRICREDLNTGLFLLGMSAVFLLSLAQLSLGVSEAFSGALRLDSLFRLPRAAIPLLALMLGCFTLSSKTLPEPRKPEALFMISALVLLGRLLLLSQNYLVSFLCLLGMAIPAIFLTGLSFRDANEGEATLKWWFQTGVMVIVGFGGILLLLLLSGSLQYADIGNAILGLHRPEAFGVTLLFLFPFLAIAGLFPMHFITIDRDHGAPWAAQAVGSILVSGVATLALLKAGVAIYHNSEIGRLPMQILEGLALLAAFWCCLGAYTQRSTKRFLAFFSASQWAALLLVAARPTTLSLSASIYYFLALSLSLSLIYATIGAFHERVSSDDMASTYGMGRHNRIAGVTLLMGLCFFLYIPPLMGFPALLHMMGALFEEQSVWRVLDFTILQLLYAFVAVHLVANIFFRDADPYFALHEGNGVTLQYSKKVALVGGVIVVVLLSGGIFWDQIFNILGAAAKDFLN